MANGTGAGLSGFARGLTAGAGIISQRRRDELAARQLEANVRNQDLQLQMQREQLDQAAAQAGFKNAMTMIESIDTQADGIIQQIGALRAAPDQNAQRIGVLETALTKLNTLRGRMAGATGQPPRDLLAEGQGAGPVQTIEQQQQQAVRQAGAIAEAEARAKQAADPGTFQIIPGVGLFNNKTGDVQRIEGIQPTGTTVNVGPQFPDLPKPPSGFDYRRDPQTLQPIIDPETGTGILVPQTGGPAAIEGEEAAAAQAEERRSADLAVSVVHEDVQRALDSIGPLSTGLVGQATGGVGGSPARNLEALLKPLKARITFEQLKQLRKESTSGASGLGQVTRNEFEALGSVMGSLEKEQGAEQLRFNLRRFGNLFTKLVDPRRPLPYPSLGFDDAGRQSDQGFDASDLRPVEVLALSPQDLAGIDLNTLSPEALDAYLEATEGQ